MFVAPVVLGVALVSSASNAGAQSGTRSLQPHTTAPPSLTQLGSDLVSAQSVTTFPQSLLSELGNNLSHQSYAGGCTSAKTATAIVITSGCTFGDSTSPKIVVLFGDSLASMWQPALNWLGTTDHFRLVLVARLNCPFAALAKSAYKDPFCNQWRANAIKYINSLKPSVVIFSEKNVGSIDPTAPSASPTVFAAGIKVTMSAVHSPLKVVFLGMPYVHYDSSYSDDPGSCMAVYSTALTKCDSPVAKTLIVSRIADDTRAIHSVANTKIVTITNLVCGPKTCPVVAYDAGTPYIVFSNEFHITKWYSAELGSALGTDLKNSHVTNL